MIMIAKTHLAAQNITVAGNEISKYSRHSVKELAMGQNKALLIRGIQFECMLMIVYIKILVVAVANPPPTTP